MTWQGELLHIHIAARASAPMPALRAGRLIAGVGIEGDSYATRLGTYSAKHHIDRKVTLIESEDREHRRCDSPITMAPTQALP